MEAKPPGTLSAIAVSRVTIPCRSSISSASARIRGPAEGASAKRGAVSDQRPSTVAAAGEAATASFASQGRPQTWRTQRSEGVVGHLARPRQVPEPRVELLGRAVELQQVEPEARPLSEPLANRIVDLSLGPIELRVPRRRPGEPH